MAHRVEDLQVLVDSIHDLRAFALAADLGSLTAAAKLLGESKATVSRRITRLESALGVTLLRRTPRAVEPTEGGAAYRLRIVQIIEMLGDANGAIRKARAAPAGHLRVTIPPGLESVLAPLVAKFERDFPEVFVSLLVTERLVDLEAEHVDVALRAAIKLNNSSLTVQRLTAIDRIVVAGHPYLRERGAPASIEELASHRLVSVGDSQATASFVMRRVHGAGPSVEIRVPAATATTSVRFAAELAIAGAGIAVLPRVSVQRELDDGRLVQVLEKHVVTGTSLYFLHTGGPFPSSKVRAFREFMNQAFLPPRASSARGAPSAGRL